MARTSRSGRPPIDAWPGFVDALSTLLLAIIFLLVVFVLGQFFLGQMLQGRDQTVTNLRGQLGNLRDQLQVEQDTSGDLRRSLARLSGDLQSLMGERDDLRARLDDREAAQVAQDNRLAQLNRERATLQRSLEEARLNLADTRNATNATQEELEAARRTIKTDRDTLEAKLGELAELNRSVDRLRETREDLRAQVARLSSTLQTAAQERDARGRRIDELEQRAGELASSRDQARQQAETLSRQISELSDQLRALDQAVTAKEGQIEDQSATIADLGRRLNLALANEVAELSRARSEFFGRLRNVLGEREDVRIVGDRFVFQSEVLFRSGEADIGAQGEEELRKLADTFKQIIQDLPSDLNWVIQVDGHTDRRPINTPRFPSNWELSAARAISVARFLVSQGIPADRVAARGFAQFQPLDPGDTEEAYRRNRRIEIKLTTR